MSATELGVTTLECPLGSASFHSVFGGNLAVCHFL